jgi:RNA polymerase sigma-70 factor, ECF subfamily
MTRLMACRGDSDAVLTRSATPIGLDVRPVLINGVAGMVTFLYGQPFSIGAVTVRNGRIVELDFLADPERLRLLDLTILDD